MTDMTNARNEQAEAKRRAELKRQVYRASVEAAELNNLIAALQVCVWEFTSTIPPEDKTAQRLRNAIVGVCDAIEAKANTVADASSEVERLLV